MSTLTGASNRFTVDVDDTNRLLTRAVSKGEDVDAALRSDGFSISSGNVTLTNAATAAIILFQNDEIRDFIATLLLINISDSAGSTSTTVEVLIDTDIGSSLVMASGSGNPVDQANLIVGSQKTIANTSEKGLEGASITGTDPNTSYAKTGVTSASDVFAIFPKGTAFAVSVTPPAANTSMVVSVRVVGYLDKGDS